MDKVLNKINKPRMTERGKLSIACIVLALMLLVSLSSCLMWRNKAIDYLETGDIQREYIHDLKYELQECGKYLEQCKGCLPPDMREEVIELLEREGLTGGH